MLAGKCGVAGLRSGGAIEVQSCAIVLVETGGNPRLSDHGNPLCAGMT